jgi:hypothetical protein
MMKTLPFQTQLSVKSTQKKIPPNNLVLVFLLLVFSGNPAICCQPSLDVLLAGFAVILAILMLWCHVNIVTPKLILIVSLFGLILLAQCISFSFYPIRTICGFYTRFFIGYAIVRMVRNFPLAYVRTMFYLAIISLICHTLYEVFIAIGFNIAEWLSPLANIIEKSGSSRCSIILHTFRNERNSGMFWEPTAFAGYLIVALTMLAIIKKELPKHDYWQYLLILSVALLSTLSTTGYIAYPLVLCLHYDWQVRRHHAIAKRTLLTVYVLLPLLVGVSTYIYTKSEFLQAKITQQLDEARYQDTSNWYQGRIGTLVFNREYIKRRPLTGWGMHEKTRFALDPHIIMELQGMGNGLADFTAQFGISGMLIWLLATFQNVRDLMKRNLWQSLFVMLILVLVLQGECFLNYPLFLGLMFLEK